ncbi:MAG: arylesterase [Gammaproteobacteria bacterium]|nr:arylesterase [Gammaproteobacteria bacterium]
MPLKNIFLVLLLAMAMVACGKKATLPALSNNATVLAFGDSLTFGTGAPPESAYPAVLKSLINRNVVGSGVPGEVSADGLARLPAVLEEVQPKLLILCHGGNDFLRKQPEAAAATNVRAMVKLALDRNINVVLMATPKPGFGISVPDFYAAIATEFSIPIETEILREVLTDNSLKSDLVHPNAAGYKKIAERIAELLKK